MIRRHIARRIGLPLQDLVTGTSIVDTFRFLMESQYWDSERMEEYRLAKLKNIVAHAYRSVPFYREEFDRVKLRPGDIASMDDLQKIPVVTREMLRSRNLDFVSAGSSMRGIRIGKTGGTTGAPVLVYKDQSDRTFTWASYYRWYKWMGLDMGSSSLTLWGARDVTRTRPADVLKTTFTNLIQNAIVINSFRLNKENMSRVVNKINSARPAIIKGYLSSLLFLAEYMEENNLELTYTPVALSSTTETLLPHHRIFLEKVFRAPMYDQYGCGEVSAIAYECPHHNGLHITQEHVITEIVDENGIPVSHSGNVIVTNLDNYIMPFIRYLNGDVATPSVKECSCGVNQPLLVSVDGRSGDTITLKDGAKVHGVFFTDILYEKGILSDRIQRFQVYQIVSGEIEFRIESHVAADEALDTMIYNALKKYFNRVDIVRKARCRRGRPRDAYKQLPRA